MGGDGSGIKHKTLRWQEQKLFILKSKGYPKYSRYSEYTVKSYKNY